MSDPRYHVPPDPDYDGRKDYQGNHDIFEMPEDQKPSGHSMPRISLNKIALAVIAIGVVILVALTIGSMVQQSSFIR